MTSVEINSQKVADKPIRVENRRLLAAWNQAETTGLYYAPSFDEPAERRPFAE